MHDLATTFQPQLRNLSVHLIARRDAILDTWRDCVQSNAKTQDISQWTRPGFHDHIPLVLDAFGHELQKWPNKALLDSNERDAAADHARHRWQQGYDLRSLVREWGYLNECVINEFHLFAESDATLNEAALGEAHRLWAKWFGECLSENVVEYHRLLQAEAATRARDLEQAILHLRLLEEERGQVLRNAAHDLRGGLSVVMGSASMMDEERLSDDERATFRQLFQKGFNSLSAMLTDLMSMARLEAGQEERKIEIFDASELLTLLCAGSQAAAQERGLFLKWSGPKTLMVEGDAVKVQRIAQNLLLNSLKYTHQGGVTFTWGDTERSSNTWEICVQDTGPGLQSGAAAPLADKLEEATESSLEIEGEALTNPINLTELSHESRAAAAPGEGVGLSIVKRLCELLNASIELQTAPETGSAFRITFPKKYEI